MSLSRYYPRPDSRPCGDIDICFPHHYQQGNALLGSPNAPTEGKHSEIVVDGVTVENHRQLLDLNYRSQKKAEEYIWKSIDDSSSDHFLPPMADMVYLLMHTICHLTAKFKLPLRNIIDLGMFLRANRDTLKPAECNKLLRQLGMTDAFNMLTQLSSEFIGADLSMFISRPLPKKDITRMRELILTKKYLESVPKNLPVLKYFRLKSKGTGNAAGSIVTSPLPAWNAFSLAARHPVNKTFILTNQKTEVDSMSQPLVIIEFN